MGEFLFCHLSFFSNSGKRSCFLAKENARCVLKARKTQNATYTSSLHGNSASWFQLTPSAEYYFYVTYIWQISDHLSDCRYRPPLLWVSIFGHFQEATFSLKIAVSLPQVSESPTFLWHLLLASLQFFSSLNVTHRTIVAYLPDLLIVLPLQLI